LSYKGWLLLQHLASCVGIYIRMTYWWVNLIVKSIDEDSRSPK